MNPILPTSCFVPDCEARVMPDGRLYIYGSWDVSGDKNYCSHELHCFSTDDLENWVDHGVIFRNDAKWTGVPWSPDAYLYAPDAIHKDGKYYLYVCGNTQFEGVAVADSPTGPFSVAEKMTPADGQGIDPAIFVDDDGQVYYFWGQYHLRGGKLAKDMKTLLSESIQEYLLTEWEHGFHEGASIRKRNGKYYMVFADINRGQATCLSYAMADNPLGPYKKCGVIIDNIYCDPKTWNNHGSIACFQGKWYVFYHRSSQNSNVNRRVCIEPITFDENGLIKEVVQTTQGCSKPLDIFQRINAATACRVMGKCYIRPYEEKEILCNCGSRHWGEKDWVKYRYLDFKDGNANAFTVRVRGNGSIQVKLENNYELCEVQFDTKQFEDVTVPVQKTKGIHALWLFFEGRDFEVESFVFLKESVL